MTDRNRIVPKLQKILRRHWHGLRDDVRRRVSFRAGGGAVASRLLVGADGFAPPARLMGEAGVCVGPRPFAARDETECAEPGFPETGFDEIVVDGGALAADMAGARGQIAALLRRADTRVVVVGARAAPLARLHAALKAHPSGAAAALDLVEGRGEAPDMLVLTKRRIGHLLLVAGPSASGKSSLMQPLATEPGARSRAGTDGPGAVYDRAAEAVAERLGVARGRHWDRPAYAKRLHTLHTPVRDRLLLQYDFSRPARHYWPQGDADPVLDVLASAARVSAVTLWTPPARLIDQARQRHAGQRGDPADSPKVQAYADPARVLAMYRDYAAAIAGRVAEHLVVEIDTEARFHDPAAWYGEIVQGLNFGGGEADVAGAADGVETLPHRRVDVGAVFGKSPAGS